MGALRLARRLPSGLLAVAIGASAGGAGCAQVFGLKKKSTTDSDAGAEDDAPATPTVASLELQRMSIGATVVYAPLDLSAQTATFLTPDASAPSGLDSVAGTFANFAWTAPVAEGAPPPSVEFTLPDYPTPIPRLFAMGTLDQKTTYGVLEHPNATPAPTGAAFAIDVSLDRAYTTESFQIYTLGSWTDTSIGPPVAMATTLAQTLPFASTGNLTGRPFEAITIDDAVIVLRFLGAQLDGVLTVAPFAMVAGNNAITGEVSAIALDQTLSVQVDPAATAARYAAAIPAVASVVENWDITAAPGYTVGNNNGPQLLAGSVVTTSSGALTGTYGNPFAGRGWPSTMIWSTSASRPYTPPGLPAMSLASGLYTLFAPTAGLHAALPQSLPTLVTMQGHALATDGMSIALDPNLAVDVSFATDTGTNTFYQLAVYELVQSGTATTYVDRLSATGAQPAFQIPRAVFEAGHTYTLRAICVNGDFPATATGNLETRNLPLSIGYLDSGAFTVTS